jgi:DNA-binding transcriptional ArsR family regulator
MRHSTPTIPGSTVKLVKLVKPVKTTTTVPTKAGLKRQAEVFKALGHPGRMAIVHALGDGEVCACQLATVAGLAASSTSRHLTVLRHAGLITDERRGQQIFYRLSCPCVLTFAECISRIDAGEKVQTLRVACCA